MIMGIDFSLPAILRPETSLGSVSSLSRMSRIARSTSPDIRRPSASSGFVATSTAYPFSSKRSFVLLRYSGSLSAINTFVIIPSFLAIGARGEPAYEESHQNYPVALERRGCLVRSPLRRLRKRLLRSPSLVQALSRRHGSPAYGLVTARRAIRVLCQPPSQR